MIRESKSSRRYWYAFNAFVDSWSHQISRRSEAILDQEANRAASAYGNGGEGAALASVNESDWLDGISRVWLTVVPEAGRFMENYLEGAADTARLEAAASAWLRSNGDQRAELCTQASRNRLASLIAKGRESGESQVETASRIRSEYVAVSRRRVVNGGRGEVHSASNFGILAYAMNLAEPLYKVWVASPESARHQHIDGQRKQLGEPFATGPERLMYPGDATLGASPESVMNCRCAMEFVRVRRAA